MYLNEKVITNIAATTGILASLLLALKLEIFLIVYILFFISSTLWAVYAYKIQNKQLLTMNIIFTVINIIGLYNYS